MVMTDNKLLNKRHVCCTCIKTSITRTLCQGRSNPAQLSWSIRVQDRNHDADHSQK